MQPDPWEPIGRSGEALTVRRVDPVHPADFFWARDPDGRCALVLTVAPGTTVDEPRPRLNGIEIVEAPEEDGGQAFVLVLRREEDRELFQRLCEDIVEACRPLSGDQAFLSATIRRAWKWHSLLRGAVGNRLGPEEQQGLAGELLFLESLSQRLSPKAAIDAWRGPLNEPKDFLFGDRAVEVKARHPTKEAVKVSSEHQLQVQEGQALWLVVVALAPTSPETTQAFTLDSLVERIRIAIVQADPSAEEGFESRLVSAGYSREHDYSTEAWILVSTTAFVVGDAFPRIQASDLPPATTQVSYSLALDGCAEFERSMEDVLEH